MQNRKIPSPGSILCMVIILITVLGTFDLSAQDKQKFSISNFGADPFDSSARDKKYEKRDGNGDLYAIIKVTSTNPDDNLKEYNFNFGNMNHLVEEHDGVLWVYVQKNAKIVTITREGYTPINRYDLHTTLEAGKNYVMSLTSEQKRVYRQMVQFNVTPSDAKATIMVKSFKEDASEELFGYTDNSGMAAKSLEYGSYTYKILSENYHTAEGRFTLDNKAETLIEKVDLRPNFSTVTLKTNADAQIYVNGELKGTGQWSGVLKAGSYQVECRQPNHSPTSQDIVIADNDNKTITLKNPEPITGSVAITSTPLGADIVIDDKSYGQSPKNLDLIVGKHTVELSKTGYNSASKSFEIEEDKTVEINLSLGRTTKTVIESTPSEAALFINGESKGNTPYTYDGEIGNYTVKLTKKGYKPFAKNVYFGNDDHLTFAMKKEYIKRNDIYLDAGVGFISYTNMSLALGGHIANVNVELDYSFCFDKGVDMFWNNDNLEDASQSIACQYKPGVIVGGKIGYGFEVGNRFKLAPQLGLRFTKLSEKSEQKQFVKGANCASATVGLRAYYALVPNFGVSLTPEYAVGVLKSDGFKMLSDVSSDLKKYSDGFSLRVGLVLSF